MRYDWPGNIRKLQNVVIERAIIVNSPALKGRSFLGGSDGNRMLDP
jgi:transcriptional regulator with PAS, ATPase and Fis domain